MCEDIDIQIKDYDDLNRAKDDIIFFADRYLDIKLYDYQKELIKSNILRRIVSRQIGFSMMALVKIIHTVIFNDSRTIAYISPSIRQTYDKSNYICELLDRFNSNLGCINPVKTLTRNKKYIEFENRSKILFISFSTINNMRGKTFSGLYLEDVNFTKESDFNEFINSLMPVCMSPNIENLWAWSAMKRITNNFETGDIDNIYKLSWAEIENVPLWFTSDSIFRKYKNLKESLTLEQIKTEYLLGI